MHYFWNSVVQNFIETENELEEDDDDGEGFEDLVEPNDAEQMEDEVEDDEEEEGADDYMLTPAAARELMMELRDPMEVAKFVVESDDAAGFLRALRLLLHDGYVSHNFNANIVLKVLSSRKVEGTIS